MRASIESDVDNMASLVRLSGLAPNPAAIADLLAEAKQQLRHEADYERERDCLQRYCQLLAGDPNFVAPEPQDDLTTSSVLAMTYVGGAPVESYADAPQAVRDRIVTLLIDLLFRELFGFQFMQTDPNFANYRYDEASGRLVLLDFGATRDLPDKLCEGYRQIGVAGANGDFDGFLAAARGLGLVSDHLIVRYKELIERLFPIATAPLRTEGPYDFSASNLAASLRDAAMAADYRDALGATPPIDAVYAQRKIGGALLLALRLKAGVDVRALFAPYA